MRGVEVRTKQAVSPPKRASATAKIRSSPVYAGHTIKPLKKRSVSSQSACSLGQDRGLPASRTTPAASIGPIKRVSFLSSIQTGCPLKGMISYRSRLSECAHGRASDSQRVRRWLFSGSDPACQGQNSHQFCLSRRPQNPLVWEGRRRSCSDGWGRFSRFLTSPMGWRCCLRVPSGGTADKLRHAPGERPN